MVHLYSAHVRRQVAFCRFLVFLVDSASGSIFGKISCRFLVFSASPKSTIAKISKFYVDSAPIRSRRPRMYNSESQFCRFWVCRFCPYKKWPKLALYQTELPCLEIQVPTQFNYAEPFVTGRPFSLFGLRSNYLNAIQRIYWWKVSTSTKILNIKISIGNHLPVMRSLLIWCDGLLPIQSHVLHHDLIQRPSTPLSVLSQYYLLQYSSDERILEVIE
jgi:hypothetical protein